MDTNNLVEKRNINGFSKLPDSELTEGELALRQWGYERRKVEKIEIDNSTEKLHRHVYEYVQYEDFESDAVGDSITFDTSQCCVNFHNPYGGGACLLFQELEAAALRAKELWVD